MFPTYSSDCRCVERELFKKKILNTLFAAEIDYFQEGWLKTFQIIIVNLCILIKGNFINSYT